MAIPVDDPVVDYRYKSNAKRWIGDVVYTYNQAGYRDVNHEEAKPAAIERIVVVGDSVTDGYGVKTGEMFSRKIQALLGDEFEVITIAMGGLNTPQEIHLLEKDGLRYEPDLVVLNFILNDCDFYSRLQPAVEYNQAKDSEIGLLGGIRINPALKRWLKSSALIYFVKERVEELVTRAPEGETEDYVRRIWSQQENRQKILRGFDHLAELQREHGFEAVVLVWPVLVRLDSYPYQDIHDWVVARAAERGLQAIDLAEDYAPVDTDKLKLTPEDVFHPNARGHEIAANRFMQWHGNNRGTANPRASR